MATPTPKIFLDANVVSVRQAAGRPLIPRVADLVDAAT